MGRKQVFHPTHKALRLTLVKGKDLSLKVVTDTNKNLAKQVGVPEGYAVQCGVIVGYATAEETFSLGERIKKGGVQYLD